MTRRSGTWLLVAGIIAVGVGAVTIGMEAETIVDALGAFVLAWGLLTLALGVGTIAVSPRTAMGVLVITVLGFAGQLVGLAFIAVLTGTVTTRLVSALLVGAVVLLPMPLGYLVGALQSVPDPGGHRRLTVLAAGVLLVWAGWYGGATLARPIGGGGFGGAVFLGMSAVVLLGSIVGGTALYGLCRLAGPDDAILSDPSIG